MIARLQSAIVTVYHFFSVPLTLGLSVLVAIFETMYVKTGDETYKKMTKFWGKLFLINFAMGVVTGIVQEFQFRMNWSEYSRFMGDIFGAPLAIEALLAFYLESIFIGVWIFGWDKISKRLHAVVIWLVAMDRFDEIIVLDNGRIVECGTHADLVASAALYRQLADARTVELVG